MATSFYEIVVLPGGDVVLQRVDDGREQLVRITFSQEVRSFLGNTSIHVAKAMIDAGLDAVEQLDTDTVADDVDGPGGSANRIVH